MAFSMTCLHKGCGSFMEPYLDMSGNKVYCSSCDKEIVNVTNFVKTQMKTLNQFKPKKNIAFGVKCKSCNKEDLPKLFKDELICPHCNNKHAHLSEPFKLILKDKLKKPDNSI